MRENRAEQHPVFYKEVRGNMKTTIVLDERDIAKIIAEKFNCEVTDVTVEVVTQRLKLYGGETEVQKCSATVKKDTPF